MCALHINIILHLGRRSFRLAGLKAEISRVRGWLRKLASRTRVKDFVNGSIRGSTFEIKAESRVFLVRPAAALPAAFEPGRPPVRNGRAADPLDAPCKRKIARPSPACRGGRTLVGFFAVQALVVLHAAL